MCHNLAVTGLHKTITNKTIPTMVPLRGNRTGQVLMQDKVTMEDKEDMQPAKVSRHL
jgi:hypothetical protein